jgi:hypothetical protein
VKPSGSSQKRDGDVRFGSKADIVLAWLLLYSFISCREGSGDDSAPLPAALVCPRIGRLLYRDRQRGQRKTITRTTTIKAIAIESIVLCLLFDPISIPAIYLSNDAHKIPLLCAFRIFFSFPPPQLPEGK